VSLLIAVRLVVALVVELRVSTATTRAFLGVIGSAIGGFPLLPPTTFEATKGEVVATPTKDAALSLIASESPVIFTDKTPGPLVVATVYHTSVLITPLRVYRIRPRGLPFHVEDPTNPPPTTCPRISAERTTSALLDTVGCTHVFVVVPVRPEDIFVDVDSRRIVEVAIVSASRVEVAT
jgi:hypothetical protein